MQDKDTLVLKLRETRYAWRCNDGESHTRWWWLHPLTLVGKREDRGRQGLC